MLSIFTAKFNIVIIVSLLVLVHELGHILCARLFNIKLIKLIIYPLGGISKFNMPLNIGIIKELIILLCGPLFQFIGYFILLKVFINYKSLIINYHYSILIFNLLPIYPLDGGKIINLILQTTIPYKKSFILTFIISYIFIFIFFILNIKIVKINMIIMFIFLVYKIIEEHKNIKYIYNKFLLERYLKKYRFIKCNIIKNGNNFYRNKRHLIEKDNIYYLESEYLKKMYKKY